MNRRENRIPDAWLEPPGPAGPPGERRRVQWRNVILCCVAVLGAAAAIYPVCNQGYLDDFSYAGTALQFARTGHVIYNGWAPATQGWMILWGALFIRLFGFSFTALRMADVVLAAITLCLFHSILVRFGVRSGNALFGALVLALSPIFVPLATSFMTDVPALLALLLCMWMCQRAVAARSAGTTAAWLAAAALVNVAAGTVRQNAWLGALVMVPSTAWLLRNRRRVLPAAIAAVAASAGAIWLLMLWFRSRPFYFEDPAVSPLGITVPHSPRMLAAEFLKVALCLLLLLLPVLSAWLPRAPHVAPTGYLRLAGALGVMALWLWDAARRGRLVVWLAPWLHCTLHRFPAFGPVAVDQLFGSSVELPRGLAIAIGGFTVVGAWLAAEQVLSALRGRAPTDAESRAADRSLAWMAGPTTLAYLGLLALRAEGRGISDRYVLVLLPFAVIVLLRLYQHFVAGPVPLVSFLVLAVFGFEAIADAHDYYADQRAGDAAIRRLQEAGVPRTSISQSENGDAWQQVSLIGHIHWSGDPRLDGARPVSAPRMPAIPCQPYIAPVTPVVQPDYLIVYSPSPCLNPSRFGAVSYRAWLPPFHRMEYIEEPKYPEGPAASNPRQ